MTGQVLRRLLLAVPLVLAVSFLTFLLSRLAGGTWFDQLRSDRRFDPATIRALERRAHLDEPVVAQWLHWLRGICFDVHIGRPHVTLQGFEAPLVDGRDYVASAGVKVDRTGEESHDGVRALRVEVSENGGTLRVPVPQFSPSKDAEVWGWQRDAGPDGTWRSQPLLVRDGAVELRFGHAGVVYVDSIERVLRTVTLTAGVPDLGRSFRYDEPVLELLLPALANSAWLAFATLVVTWLLAIPLGVACARNPGGWLDRSLAAVSFAGASVPGFFLALLVLYATVEWINGASGGTLLPSGADRSVDYGSLSLAGKLLDRAWHLVLPVAVLTLGALASVQRTLRANLLEVLSAPFVTSARAKGLSERRVVRRHALRNAMNPLVTLFGIRLAELLSGAALVEIVFQYPGMGRLVLEATIGRDLFVLMGSVLIGALLLVVANLLADLALAWLDPRVQSVGARA